MQKDDCYWKVLRCDHHQSCDCENGDDDEADPTKEEYFADGCRESPGPVDSHSGAKDDDADEPEYRIDGVVTMAEYEKSQTDKVEAAGPMDRNFGMFLKEAQENPRPKKSKFRRRKKQVPSTMLEDVGSDDSLSREMPGFFSQGWRRCGCTEVAAI